MISFSDLKILTTFPIDIVVGYAGAIIIDFGIKCVSQHHTPTGKSWTLARPKHDILIESHWQLLKQGTEVLNWETVERNSFDGILQIQPLFLTDFCHQAESSIFFFTQDLKLTVPHSPSKLQKLDWCIFIDGTVRWIYESGNLQQKN